MAAATQVINSRITNAQADVATKIDSAAQPLAASAAVPTQATQKQPEPTTMPDLQYQAPATPVPAVAYIPPPAAPKKSSSAWVVIAIAIVLVLGGGAAAAMVGFKMYKNWQAGHGLTLSTPATTPATDTATPSTSSASALPQSTASAPAPGVLLSGSVPPTTDSASAGGGVGQAPPSVVPQSQQSGGQQVGGQTPSPVHIAQNSPLPRTTGGGSSSSVAPPVQPRPAHRASGVAIAVTGDGDLVSSVSQVINSELRSSGLKTVDAESLPSTESLVRGGNASTARLLSRLRDEGYAVLLLARVDAAGQRELKYLGRYDTVNVSKVTLTTYDLVTGRPFGTPGRGTIEYTSLNADRKAEEIVGRLARDSAEAIQNH
jgi:hypothetical protein